MRDASKRLESYEHGNILPGWRKSVVGHEPFDAADHRQLWTDANAFTVSGTPQSGIFTVLFSGFAEFEIRFPDRQIRIRPLSQSVTEETIFHLLADQVSPRIIAHQGDLVLHASAVQAPGGAIVFAGRSGFGKSTLAASFHTRGLPLIGDDAVVVSGGDSTDMRCRAVYRSLRLFPDSIGTLLKGSPELSPVAQYTAKQNIRNLDLNGHGSERLPILAVCILGNADVAAIKLRRMAPSESCMAILEHSFWLDPTDLEQAQQRLRQSSALAAAVPAYEIDYRRAYSDLPRLHEAILAKLSLAEPAYGSSG